MNTTITKKTTKTMQRLGAQFDKTNSLHIKIAKEFGVRIANRDDKLANRPSELVEALQALECEIAHFQAIVDTEELLGVEVVTSAKAHLDGLQSELSDFPEKQAQAERELEEWQSLSFVQKSHFWYDKAEIRLMKAQDKFNNESARHGKAHGAQFNPSGKNSPFITKAERKLYKCFRNANGLNPTSIPVKIDHDQIELFEIDGLRFQKTPTETGAGFKFDIIENTNSKAIA